MTAVTLRRIDDARNMRRFYRLDVQPDLFGGALLLRQWPQSRGGRNVALDCAKLQCERSDDSEA